MPHAGATVPSLPDWAESLAENLLHPSFPISMWEAFGRRYRRNYLWIYLILSLAWMAKILPFTTRRNPAEFFKLLSIGFIPGEYVLLAGIASMPAYCWSV